MVKTLFLKLLIKSFVLQKETQKDRTVTYLTTSTFNHRAAEHTKDTRSGLDWCPAVSYHTVNKDAERNPEDEGKHHDRAHYVISQELSWWRGWCSETQDCHVFLQGWINFKVVCRKQLTKCVDVQLVDKIPQPLNHILYLLHALSLFEEGNS